MNTESHDHESHVELSTETPHGRFPNEGARRVPIDEPVNDELLRAKEVLGLHDTDDWVVRVVEPDGGTRAVEPQQSFRQNALRGHVKLEWHPRHTVRVSISTTAGFFPAEGFNAVPVRQAVNEELHKAKEALKIRDVDGWVASVIERHGKRLIDPQQSYEANRLSGKVEIDWGPSEGGGG
jgi:hypothetical protein